MLYNVWLNFAKYRISLAIVCRFYRYELKTAVSTSFSEFPPTTMAHLLEILAL